ncbi:ABC transporter substrate-binding protein [Daejeonella sp.]|uniref:ABC transporter substrate-binding protein n=1 Tax=Daejeonella sp. TaxID=2805397 RepID=UPI00271DC6E9|nr:ABC transporter substrate-binding protein [Daejeonella sp.]MDO8992197.1 ABC transporter substrate-binding protein [Daejeonella sp.]MDP2415735.1 ABC transporter substrate-binding protein [Daejeonella sp.]
MKINFHVLTQYAALILLCLNFPFQAISQELKPIKLQLKWLHQFQFAGYYAAKEKGFYKDAGFDVEILQGNALNPPVDNVLKGKADFGVTGSDILNSFINKKPVVVVSVIFQHSPYIFMTLSDSKINSPSDLAGKTIMVSEDQGGRLLKALLLDEGIPIDSVNIIEHNWQIQDLIERKVDAQSAYITVEPQILRQMGHQVSIINPINYGIDFYGDLLFTTVKMANSQPGTVEKFNEASLKGWQYAMDHPEEITEYILELPGVKSRGISREQLLYEAKEMKELILPELVEIGHMNPGRWLNMLNIYKKLGLADKDVTIEGLLFRSSSTKKVQYFDYLLYVIGVAGILVVLILIGTWQLRKQVLKRTADLQTEIMNRTKAEQRLEIAIEAAGLSIWSRDLNTSTVIYDRNWFQNQGIDPDVFLKDDTLIASIHPDDQTNVKQAITELRKGKNQYNNLIYRIRTIHGDWKWLLSFSKMTNSEGSGTGNIVIGSLLDIDFIKRKEIELQEITKELRKKNNELEKFAYITSHNLRAPVVNLISLTELQQETSLSQELQDEIRQNIHECVRQLDNTLNDLVEIVASQSGKSAKSEDLDLQTELNMVIKTIENQIRSSGAKIEVNLAKDLKIHFPRHYLHSILLNLFTNAIKYKSKDRDLVISLKTREGKDFTQLFFSDNGIGINLDKYGNKIFGLYQRFHTNIDGKGLGLYIIKSQIEAMDGKIEVDSLPDVGTTFCIYFKNHKNTLA